jgi:hypothetical protein
MATPLAGKWTNGADLSEFARAKKALLCDNHVETMGRILAVLTSRLPVGAGSLKRQCISKITVVPCRLPSGTNVLFQGTPAVVWLARALGNFGRTPQPEIKIRLRFRILARVSIAPESRLSILWLLYSVHQLPLPTDTYFALQRYAPTHGIVKDTRKY